ncbi:MAG: hypothetical protein ABIM29_02755 [candidate division WOR-3 bacterium]
MKMFLVLIINQIVPGFNVCEPVKNTGFGAYFLVGERFGFCASFEVRLSENLEGGIKPAFLFKSNGDTKAGIGVDGNLNFLVFKSKKDYPFNISVIPHTGFYFEEKLLHFFFLTDFLIDYKIPLEDKLEIIPYGGGGMGIGFESKEIKGENETDVYPGVEVKLGFLFKFTQKTSLFSEIFISTFNSAFGLGVNFEI